MATALDRWDEEGGAQELAWPLPYEASDLRDVERRVLECLGAALVSEWNDLPTDVQRRLFEHAASGKIARRHRVEDADRSFPARS